MAYVSSLWIGKPLSIAHKVALRSFVHYGHSLKLYVYDMNLEVPPGITKVDANTIVPQSEVFFHYGKLTAFADYFRYVMILKTNEMWADVDTICLSEYFFDDKEYVFIEEIPEVYAQGILKMPSNSDLSLYLNKSASRLKFQKRGPKDIFVPQLWAFLGPTLLTKAVKRLSLQKHAQPALVVNGLDLSVENPYELLWNPKNCDLMLERLTSSVSLTFFNSALDLWGFGDKKDVLPKGSLMWEFQKKFF